MLVLLFDSIKPTVASCHSENDNTTDYMRARSIFHKCVDSMYYFPSVCFNSTVLQISEQGGRGGKRSNLVATRSQLCVYFVSL